MDGRECQTAVHCSLNEVGKPCFFLGESCFSVYEEMASQLRQLGWREVRSKSRIGTCDLILGDRFTIPYHLLRCEPLLPDSHFGGRRWVNYFRGSHRLTLKASMARLLREADSTSQHWMPRTFVLGGEQEKRKDDRFLFLKEAEAHPAEVWIIKPSSGSKGQGILLVQSLNEIEQFIDALDPRGRSLFVAQRYVDRPLLYCGRKFDIRVWALLTCPYTVYAFSQGSCRRDDISDRLVHVTNHCLQEGSEHFGRYEGGNELWFEQLSAYLIEVYKTDVLGSCIWPQIANIIVRTLLAVREELKVFPDEPYRCFQMFGYDLIVEEGMIVRLLEINGSPGVAVRYLKTVVREILALVNGGDSPRQWDVELVGFVKLWCDGDTEPQAAE
uniref:Tubulin--tyrosine ligase n=1 Tax=Trypanosoma vivax (strain Y486) TaxID=1055687 RepID=G0TS44_TRYVY|nr:putative tubulin-tyrosine ligase, fragment [Trypanosoma vivax Y486]